MPNPTGKGLKPFTKNSPRASEAGKKSKRIAFDVRLRDKIEGDGTIENVMDVLSSLASQGDIQAIKELLDRTYGKAKQSIDLGNSEESGFKLNITKKYNE